MQENLNPFAIAQQQFDRAADMLNLDAGTREVLRRPKRALLVSVPTKMDDGTVKVFEGFRVQHNIARARTVRAERQPSTPRRKRRRVLRVPRDAARRNHSKKLVSGLFRAM